MCLLFRKKKDLFGFFYRINANANKDDNTTLDSIINVEQLLSDLEVKRMLKFIDTFA
mgnify:CR=1 FL=1